MLQALCWSPDIYAILNNSESHLLLHMKKLKLRKVKLHLHGQMAKQSGSCNFNPDISDVKICTSLNFHLPLRVSAESHNFSLGGPLIKVTQAVCIWYANCGWPS